MTSTSNATPPVGATAHTGDRRRGAALRSKIADSTIVQACIAGALSFTHIRDVAVMGGQTGWKGWAYPLIVDLITMSAYRKVKRNRDAGESTGLPWTWLIVGMAVSISANIIDAIVHAPARAAGAQLALCIVVGVWPAIAFFGSMLLRHSGKPADRQSAADEPAAAKPTSRPTVRPTKPTAQQRPVVQPTASPPPIPVRPSGQPQPLGDLGPRASVGELPLPVWVQIGHPIYQQIKSAAGGRPTEKALQDALGQRITQLISAGVLPAAVGKPSLSTAKRVRRAVEDRHPELTARSGKPLQLTAATP